MYSPEVMSRPRLKRMPQTHLRSTCQYGRGAGGVFIVFQALSVMRLLYACYDEAMENLTFRPLEASDYPLFARWLGRPHVAKWWHEPATVEHVAEKYSAADRKTPVFVVEVAGKPVGVIQMYKWADYPDDAFEPSMIGIDYLIGEEGYVGRGVGSAMIRQFVEQVVRPRYPDATGVATSAEVANGASVGALRKAGFEPGEIITGEYGTPEQVMTRRF